MSRRSTRACASMCIYGARMEMMMIQKTDLITVGNKSKFRKWVPDIVVFV